jgi:hypothetical protein
MFTANLCCFTVPPTRFIPQIASPEEVARAIKSINSDVGRRIRGVLRGLNRTTLQRQHNHDAQQSGARDGRTVAAFDGQGIMVTEHRVPFELWRQLILLPG